MSTPNERPTALRRRWSPRAFSQRPLSNATIHTLLQAARWAPSAFNEQPWRFIVAPATDADAHQRLSACLMDGNAWAEKAPLLIIACAKKTFSHNGEPNGSHQHDLGISIGLLLAQATHLGLFAHPMGGFHRDKAMETLGIPDDFAPTCALAIGYRGPWQSLPTELQQRELAPRQRHPLAELAHIGHWNDPVDFGHARWEEVLSFWFGEMGADGIADKAHRDRFWQKDAAFDDEICNRFGALYQDIAMGKCQSWLSSARGCLAYVIVLDQFSRNMFRDQPRMYAQDDRALTATKDAIDAGLHRELAGDLRSFLFMPLMHSEDLADQDRCVALFESFRDESQGELTERLSHSVQFAISHRDIVARFGRFPHRNGVLLRPQTPQEIDFLKEPGSSF